MSDGGNTSELIEEQIKWLEGVAARRREQRPATRYGRWVVFEGGYARKLGLIEWALVKCRIKTTVARTRGRRES